MNLLDPIQSQKIERIKELLSVPSEERTEKMCLELMSFTKDFKLFENIAMSLEHQKICATMSLVNYKPNDIIVKQGNQGESFYYILTGTVNVRLNIDVDTECKEGAKLVHIDKLLNVLKSGQTFGELSLLYGTPITASVVSVTNSSLIRIDKEPFDKYVKNIFENQLQDQIEFLKICPIFHKVDKDLLIRLAVRTEIKKFSTGQKVLTSGKKCDSLYLIRRGTIKVIKCIKFSKNTKLIRDNVKKNIKKTKFTNFDNYNANLEVEHELVLERLALGPSEEDLQNNDFIEKNITLETLKIGDIFPSYYTTNSLYLDVSFEANNPCDIIIIKLSDLKDIVSETEEFIKVYSKPYPDDIFLRKFYYYNEAWMKYRNTLKYNILADSLNKDVLKKNKMRSKLFIRKDLESVKLPEIFSSKRAHFK